MFLLILIHGQMHLVLSSNFCFAPNSVATKSAKKMEFTTEQTTKHFPLLHIEGQVQMKNFFNENKERRKRDTNRNIKKEIESEIEAIFKMHDMVDSANVSVIDIGNFKSELIHARTMVKFVAISSIRTSTLTDKIDEIRSSIITFIQNINPNSFLYFDAESFASFQFKIAEPKIIKIKSSSKAEKFDKIGLLLQ